VQGFFERARTYLAAVKYCTYSIPEAVREVVTSSMAEAKAADRTLSGEDLHKWLAIARLYSISRGESLLSVPLWEAAMALERNRKTEIARSKGTVPTPVVA
jgi:hypothetical protein